MRSIVQVDTVHLPYRKVLVWSLILMASTLCGSMTAQESISRSMQIMHEWESAGTVRGQFSAGVVSRDGSLEAHLGPLAFEDGLYVKNLSTGEDKLIVNSARGYTEFDSISFSPDEAHIVFRACPPLGASCPMPKIFTVRIDGSDLVDVADSFVDKESGTEYDPTAPVYSPDGTMVLVNLEAIGNLSDLTGNRVSGTFETYLGLATLANSKTAIKILAKGSYLFWSTNGDAVYFGSDEGISRFDMEAKTVTIIDTGKQKLRVLGKTPGLDAAFVQNQSDDGVEVLPLNGTAVSQEVKDLAAGISVKDLQGRWLRSIQALGQRKLLLRYDNGREMPDLLRQHIQLLSF